MSIFNRQGEMKREVAELRASSEKMAAEITRYRGVQETLVKDILTLQEVSRTYVGNDYQDYTTAVQEISEKYTGLADWGVLQTRTVIDLRGTSERAGFPCRRHAKFAAQVIAYDGETSNSPPHEGGGGQVVMKIGFA